MHDLSSPTVLWHKVYGINPYPAMWSAMWGFAWEIIEACPAQPCKEGKGGTEGERRARKEGREAKPYRNQVGISNYSSTSAGSWMHGREAINNLPQSFPRPHRSTFHLHQPLILLLPASLYSIWLLKRRSLSLSLCTWFLTYRLWTRYCTRGARLQYVARWQVYDIECSTCLAVKVTYYSLHLPCLCPMKTWHAAPNKKLRWSTLSLSLPLWTRFVTYGL